MGVRVFVVAAAVAAMCVASPAWAQLPVPLPPPQPQPAPPPPPPAPAPVPVDGSRDAGPGETGMYGGAARANAVAGDTAAGPLYRAWSKTFKGPANHPLIIGSRVVVNVANGDNRYGSSVQAFDVRSGKRLWVRPTPGVYFSAPIAADRSMVVSVNREAVVRGIALSDGALRWEVKFDGYADVIPAIRGGLVLLPLGGLVALDADTGEKRYAVDVPATSIAIDGDRVIATSCDSAAAVALDSGRVLWRRAGTGETCGEPRVADGRVHLEQLVLDAATGATVAGAPASFGAILGGTGYRGGAVVRAVRLADGKGLWSTRLPGGGFTEANVGPLTPVVAQSTIFAATPGAVSQLNPATGRVRWTSRITGESGFSAVGGLSPGMAVSSGAVAIGNGRLLSVFAPVLQPAARGIDLAWAPYDAHAGQSISVVGRTGPQLGGVRMAVQLDPFPRSRFRTARTMQPDSDRVAETTVRVRRNSRIRLHAAGVASRAFTVYAYPRVRWGRLAVGRDGVVRQPVTYRGVPTRGRRVVLYLGRASKDVAVRLGSAPLRGGRAVVRFPLLKRVRRKDQLIVCVPGLARAGYGRLTRLDRRCGARTIRMKI